MKKKKKYTVPVITRVKPFKHELPGIPTGKDRGLTITNAVYDEFTYEENE